MATAWSGLDPTEVGDATDYELGTRYRAEQDITITHIRIHAGAGEVNQAGRKARLWTSAGVELASVDLPTNLDTGWSEHQLATPVQRTAGSVFVVTFSTYGNYSALANGVLADRASGDGAVTALANGGRFITAPGSFPTTATNTFYGTDFTYFLGVGGNTAPVITALTVTTAGATATATMTITDTEGLTGATYSIDWGDGTSPSTGVTSAQHTYTASGLYAVLGSVTDSGGLSDHAATAVDVHVPDPAVLGLDPTAMQDRLVSHALRLGVFDVVNGHEPDNPPTSGLACAVSLDSIEPIISSGASVTSARVAWFVQVFLNANSEPADTIDTTMLTATSALIQAYCEDFTLDGTIRQVDIFGAHGPKLSARAGYMTVGNTKLRAMVITLPLIANDVWNQEP